MTNPNRNGSRYGFAFYISAVSGKCPIPDGLDRIDLRAFELTGARVGSIVRVGASRSVRKSLPVLESGFLVIPGQVIPEYQHKTTPKTRKPLQAAASSPKNNPEQFHLNYSTFAALPQTSRKPAPLLVLRGFSALGGRHE
jgi:hypothetical protein